MSKIKFNLLTAGVFVGILIITTTVHYIFNLYIWNTENYEFSPLLIFPAAFVFVLIWRASNKRLMNRLPEEK